MALPLAQRGYISEFCKKVVCWSYLPSPLQIRPLGALPFAEQPTYPGPTWLDRQQTTQRLRAMYGFGAEVQQALSQRAAFLCTLGIDPQDQQREQQLRQLECQHFARAQQERIGSMTPPNAGVGE